MGLTTQDPYIQKEHTELYKILKFRVNCANIEQDTAIQKRKNLVTNVWIAGHLSGNPYIFRTLVQKAINLSIRLFFLAGKEKEATGKEKPDTRVFIAVFHLLMA